MEIETLPRKDEANTSEQVARADKPRSECVTTVEATGNHALLLREFTERLRPILARQMADAAEMVAIMADMRKVGLRGAVLKRWLKAEIAYRLTGSDRALKKLIAEAKDAQHYGAVLGHGDLVPTPTTKDFIVNEWAAPAECTQAASR